MNKLEVRYGRLHNASMAVVSVLIVGAGIAHFLSHPERAPSLSLNDPRFGLMILIAGAMLYYALLGLSHFNNREPQVVIDEDGLTLGFGRNKRFSWDEVQWVRLRRVAFRPQLQIGLQPEAFVAANLKLSMWNLDDALRPVRGTPAAVLLRDNGLDTSSAAMLDAIKAIRPQLVKT